MVLTIAQRVVSVEEYLKCNVNVKLLLINFAKKFPNAESVNRRHVTRLVSKFRTHGTVCNLPHVRDKTVLLPAIEKVREVLTVNPTKSLRRIMAIIHCGQQAQQASNVCWFCW